MSKGNNEFDNIINTISKKLGAEPDKLKEAAQKGNVNEVIKNLKPQDAEKIQKILSDKDATKKLLSTPKAQQLLKKFMGEK